MTARPLNRLSIQKPSLSTGTIYLPKEYNPSLALTNLENRYGFVSRTFHSDSNKVEAQQEPLKANEEVEDMVQNAFTNRLFEGKIKSHTFPIDGHNPFFYPKNNKAVENIDKTVSCDYSQIITARRTKELQIIGCLIVELFMAKQLRTLGDCGTKTSGFSSRLSACLTAVKHCRHEMPLCIQ